MERSLCIFLTLCLLVSLTLGTTPTPSLPILRTEVTDMPPAPQGESLEQILIGAIQRAVEKLKSGLESKIDEIVGKLEQGIAHK